MMMMMMMIIIIITNNIHAEVNYEISSTLVPISRVTSAVKAVRK